MEKLPNPKPSIRTRKCNWDLKTCWIKVCTTTTVVGGMWTPNLPDSCCSRFHQHSFCVFQPVLGDLSALFPPDLSFCRRLSGSSQQQQDWFATTHCCFHFYFLSEASFLVPNYCLALILLFHKLGGICVWVFVAMKRSFGLSVVLRFAADLLCPLAVFSWLMASSCCSYCSTSSQLLFQHF